MKHLLCLSAALGLGLVPAHATLINYTATGTFNCVTCVAPGTGTSITSTNAFGTSTITYTGASDQVDAPAFPGLAALNLGSFVTTSTIPVPNPGAPFQGTFTLTVTQTAPAPTSGNPIISTATMTGTLRQEQSTVVLTFGTTTGTIQSALGTTIINIPSTLIVRDPSQGTTSLEGSISFTPIPEPGSLVMLSTGIGLMAVGMLRRRK